MKIFIFASKFSFSLQIFLRPKSWFCVRYPRPDATERNWDENPLDADFAEKYEFEHDLPE